MAAEIVAALISSSIAAGVEAVKAVGAILSAGRSVIIEIDNNTTVTFDRFTDHHESGGFAVLPPLRIPPMTAVVFGSQSKGSGVATGTVGSITYTGGGVSMLVGWANPFSGDNKTNVGSGNSGLGGPNASQFLVIHQTGAGNSNAQMRFMIFPHPPYSLREVVKEKDLVLKGPADLSNNPFRALFPGAKSMRDILPNSTAIDAT